MRQISERFDYRPEGKRKHLKTDELVPCDKHPDRPAVRFEKPAKLMISHAGYLTMKRKPRKLCRGCYSAAKRRIGKTNRKAR